MTTFGKTWWGRKWLDAFIGIDDKDRLDRGRAYANAGYVLNISVNGSFVKANVTGSRPKPYRIKISLKPFGEAEKSKIIKILELEPSIILSLMKREITESLFNKFFREKISLFPKDWRDISSSCSCPDWGTPCKHVAAVIYFIAGEIDRNPFFIFEIKGCDLLNLIYEGSNKRLWNAQDIPLELSSSEKKYKLYLAIEDDNQKFTLRLQIETAEQKIPIDLKVFLQTASSEKKLAILSNIAILCKYIPKIENSIDQDLTVNYSLKEFAPLFLNILPILKTLGIDIILPKTLKNIFDPKVNISINGSINSTKKQRGLRLSEVLDFDWSISVGDNKIEVDEFKELVKNSDQLVRLIDGYMIMDDVKIQSILKKIENPPKKLSKNELLQAILAGKFEESYIENNSYIEDCLNTIREVKSIDIPKNLNAILRPYQERGFQWMVTNIQNNFGSILADDMGLGKTLQAITVLLYLKNNRELTSESKAIIVVPTGLIINWQRELQRFAPDIKIYTFHGKEKTISEDCDIVLTTYGTVRSEKKEFQKNRWFLFIIDEAQNIKNSNTEQSKAIKSISSQYKIALSGTPVENRLSEYWSIFDFVNKGYLGSLKSFQNNFSDPIEKHRCKETLDKFKKVTSPFIMRRLKSDKSVISDLPSKIEKNIYCSLNPEQAAIYQEVVDFYTVEMAKESPLGQHKKHRLALILKMLTALKQICNHPSNYTKSKDIRVDESGKLQTLIEIVNEILMNSDEKIIIFTQFTEMGEILSKSLKNIFEIDIPFLYGGLDLKARDTMILEFQSDLQKRILLISLKAGGTGLNLVEANHVIHYDLWWNPAVENQATDRAYRIGQNRNVMVYRLISIGTLEEQIDNIISNKKELANLTVSSGESWITKMSNDDLREIIKLR